MVYNTDLGQLHNKDCIEFMNDCNISPNLVITSPPYNLGIKYDTHNDLMPRDEYFKWIHDVFSNIYNMLPDDGRLALNIPYETNFKKVNGGRVFFVSEYWKILQDIGYGWAGLVDLKEVNSNRSNTAAWGSWLSPSAPYIHNSKECVMILYKNVWKRINKGQSYFNKDNKKEFIKYVFSEWDYKSESRKLTEANF
jgi:site-specific DNA-methyltransferase (adenine-specific)